MRKKLLSGLLYAPERLAAAFQRFVHELLIHDQEGAQPVEVVHVAFAREVVRKIRNVRTLADVDDVRHTILAAH